MKSKLLARLIQMTDALPLRIRTLPYLTVLSLLRRTVTHHRPHLHIWERNSIAQGNFTMGLSDLDITLFSTRPYTSIDIHTARSCVRWCKRLFPLLGECNVYDENDVSMLSHLANPFELERDPTLARMHPSPTPATWAQAVVFLLRMLYADRQNLRNCPHLRIRKWDRHLSQVEMALGLSLPKGPLSPERLIDTIAGLFPLSSTDRLAIARSIMDYFNTEDGTNSIFSISPQHHWRHLFPHRHLWFMHEEADLNDLRSLRGEEIHVLLMQIQWEFWGLTSQYRMMTPGPDIEHLQRLKRVARVVAPDGADFQAFDFLIRQIQMRPATIQ